MATPEEIAAEGMPDPDKPFLRGGGRQILKRGGLTAANADFERLLPVNVDVRPNGARVGKIVDGRTIIVRPLSTPTLEIQADRKAQFKIRYGS